MAVPIAIFTFLRVPFLPRFASLLIKTLNARLISIYLLNYWSNDANLSIEMFKNKELYILIEMFEDIVRF